MHVTSGAVHRAFAAHLGDYLLPRCWGARESLDRRCTTVQRCIARVAGIWTVGIVRTSGDEQTHLGKVKIMSQRWWYGRGYSTLSLLLKLQ